jgi:hypothetical protein
MFKDAKELEGRPVEVNLTGPGGNAFMLMGMAKGWAEQLNKDWYDIRERMMKGDYENLLKVLEKEFGKYVTFYR